MITLEKAISRLEDIVSGSYKQKFLNSELRNNTKEAAELLKFSFMSLLKINRTTVKSAAIETILTTILDDTPLPEQWQKRGRITYLDNVQGMREEQNILNDPDVLNECIECCNVILKKVGSDDVLPKSDRDGMTIRELNKRYINKYLYFRNDEIGSQYVWVKNIHKNTEGHFEVDGTVIFTNGPVGGRFSKFSVSLRKPRNYLLMPSATSARITALTFRPNCRTNRPSMPRQSVTSSCVRGRKSRKGNVLAADDSGLIRTKCCIKRKGSPRKSAVVRCKKKYDYPKKSDNALRRCSTFVPVKASEPKVRHFRPVPTIVSIRSDVIYDPFR